MSPRPRNPLGASPSLTPLALCLSALTACSLFSPPSSSSQQPASASPSAASAPAHAHAHGHDHGAHPHPPGAHADHNPRHGGTLAMVGDYHIETVVTAEGRVFVYLSDAVRTEYAASEFTGTIERRGGDGSTQTLALRPDAERGALTAEGPAPAGMTTYAYALEHQGHAVRGSALVPPGGNGPVPAPRAANAGGDHAAGAAHTHGSPHGGVVASAPGGGHIEMRAETSGRTRVWLLDDREQPQSARGARATVRFALPERAQSEEALAYAPEGDLLEATLAPLPARRVPAIVTVTYPDGRVATVRVALDVGGGEGPSAAPSAGASGAP